MSVTESTPLPLTEGELHLWYTLLDDVGEERAVAYERLLTEEERVRRERFAFARHRRLFLVTRALVRTTLSRYSDVDPVAWQFAEGAQGKPHIVNEGVDLQFNLSHTDRIVVCVLTRGHEVGVDVENVGRIADFSGLSRRFFADPEHEDLMRQPSHRIAATFFHYWTLKESYIKACGGGLSIALDSFAFTPPELDPPRISFLGRDDEPSRWQFHRTTAGEFLIAAAARTPLPLRIRIERVVP
jgi:4'-phosphopantetheinyl transferase